MKTCTRTLPASSLVAEYFSATGLGSPIAGSVRIVVWPTGAPTGAIVSTFCVCETSAPWRPATSRARTPTLLTPWPTSNGARYVLGPPPLTVNVAMFGPEPSRPSEVAIESFSVRRNQPRLLGAGGNDTSLALGSLRSTNTRRSRISDGLPATSKDRVRTVWTPSATGVGAALTASRPRRSAARCAPRRSAHPSTCRSPTASRCRSRSSRRATPG